MPEDFTNTATADGGEQPTAPEQVGNLGDTAQGTQEQAQQAERTFTQSQLDEIIKDRLGKEKQRFESNPGLTWVQQQAQRYGMTVESYVEAVKQQEEQDQLNQLMQNNIPPEYAQEMIANRKFREQYQSEQQANQQKTQTDKMYQEFLDAYPDIKGDDIPVDVWQKVQQGQNLLDAYVRHENKTLHEQLNSFQTKGQVTAANQANAQDSTGSAKGQGTPDSGFISKDVYDANKGNQSWMLKNYDSIKKSMGKWR